MNESVNQKGDSKTASAAVNHKRRCLHSSPGYTGSVNYLWRGGHSEKVEDVGRLLSGRRRAGGEGVGGRGRGSEVGNFSKCLKFMFT